MDIEIKVPSLGESETEATLVSWLKQVGEHVEVDDIIAEIESDKITMEITALEAGVIKEIRKQADSTVTPGEVIGLIDSSVTASVSEQEKTAASKIEDENTKADKAKEKKSNGVSKTLEKEKSTAQAQVETTVQFEGDHERSEERLAMSGLRQRIATRLKDAQNTAAMLTTFNEVNMQAVMDLRAKHKDSFKQKHDIGLGFMSFFIKACAYAAAKHPVMNAFIDGDDIVYHNYMDVGIAVSTEKGLVVPVLRDAGTLSFAQIEAGIAELARKAREGGLMPDDLKGGTFSITNGGVFGSLLSTPILNPPQAAILGMHNIQRRPIAEGEQVVIRPMMYLALTYDHRLIDGSEAVQYLVAVKSYLESPGVALLDV